MKEWIESPKMNQTPTFGAWYYEISLITCETPGSLPVPMSTLK